MVLVLKKVLKTFSKIVSLYITLYWCIQVCSGEQAMAVFICKKNLLLHIGLS